MQPTNSQQALAELQKNQSTAQDPSKLLASQREQLGVSGAQDTVTGLRGAIDNTTKLLKQVAPSVMGRTQSSLVTNAQANRQIQNEQAPIATNLNELSGDYGYASEDLGRLQGEASQQAQLMYQGQQDRQGYLQNLYTTLYGREQQAEAARVAELERQERIRQFNEQLALQRAELAASTAALNDWWEKLNDDPNPNPKAIPAVAQSVADKDAQYLGRLMAEKDGVLRVELIAGLRKAAKAGNAEAARKFELGKQLGYWKF